jgi:hypothetical protein
MAAIGIVGARKYKNKRSVSRFIRSLPGDTVVVTSSCNGVCSWARAEAERLGLKTMVFSPDLTNIRSRFDVAKRYYDRNRQLIQACETVCAFVSEEAGLTGGIRFEVEYALKLGKPVDLRWENSDPEILANDWLRFFLKTVA